eukprot:gene25570-59720_t
MPPPGGVDWHAPTRDLWEAVAAPCLARDVSQRASVFDARSHLQRSVERFAAQPPIDDDHVMPRAVSKPSPSTENELGSSGAPQHTADVVPLLGDALRVLSHAAAGELAAGARPPAN